MILRVVSVEVCGPFTLRIRFNDGSTRRVDVRPLLEGPVFVSLRDPEFFARVSLNLRTGTVEWPNGADFAPEALQELPDEDRSGSRTAIGE